MLRCYFEDNSPSTTSGIDVPEYDSDNDGLQVQDVAGTTACDKAGLKPNHATRLGRWFYLQSDVLKCIMLSVSQQ